MSSSNHPTPRKLVSCLLILAAGLLPGCASNDAPPGPAGPGSSRKAKAALPTIVGQTTFFDGAVTAAAKVGVLTGFDRRGDGTAGEGGKPGGPPGRRGGFSMGGMGVAGASGLGPDGDLSRPPPGGEGGPGGGEGGPPPGVRPRGQPGVPPVMIHLRFTNHGTEKVEIVIADFLSALGNFVTFPSRLTLEPGQSAEVEPMTSRLAGDATGSDITLRLRLGDRQETRVITLQPETPAPPPAPAPKP